MPSELLLDPRVDVGLVEDAFSLVVALPNIFFYIKDLSGLFLELGLDVYFLLIILLGS